MLRVSLRGLAARRLRSALTALAIVLGVALVAGTFVLTDSITGAFNTIFQTIYSNTAATVTGQNAIDSSATGGAGGNGSDVPPFSQTLLPRVQALPGVKQAVGDVSGSLQLIQNGKVIQSGGAPNLGFSIDPAKPQFSSLKLVSGSWPGPTGVVIDTNTASKKHLHPGDVIGVQGQGPALRLRISGLVKFGSASSLGGATLAGLQLPTAQRLLGRVGKLDEIRASAKSGVSPKQLVAQIRKILPAHTQVRTGAQQAQQDSSSINSFLSFLKTFLLVFAGVALFVGSFVIANSLSITIAQRTREFGTLRTLGASRRQVRRSILTESFVIGAVASVIGLGVGLGLAKLLFALFNAAGFTLAEHRHRAQAADGDRRDPVGVIVTMLASLRPAIRATRVEPIAAVREGATLPEGRFAKYRTTASIATVALGVVALIIGLFVAKGTGAVLGLMGVGAVLIFIGVALLSARFVPVLATWIGWPATKIAGDRRRARARQRRTQPAADRLDGVGTDDRPRAGDARLAAVSRDHLQLQGRGERDLHRRLRRHRPEQLLADPDLRRGGGGTYAGGDRGRQRPRRPGPGVRVKPAADRRQSAGRRGRKAQLDPRLAGGVRLARRPWRIRRQRLREQPSPVARLAARRHDARRRPASRSSSRGSSSRPAVARRSGR